MRYQPKTRPRKYQAQALKRAFQNGGKYGLFLAPRTGKSKVAIDFSSALFLNHKSNLAIIVCQYTGLPVWEEQLAKHSAAPYKFAVLTGSSRKRIEQCRTLKLSDRRLTVVWVNYESTWRIEEALVKLMRRARGPILIYDEGHKLKNRAAKQSRTAHRIIAALDPYRLLLTGTSISNSPLDVFSEYQVIDNSIFGTRWKPFADRYATFSGMYNHQVKYKNLPDLRRRARQRATVLTKEECLDLPEQEFISVKIPLSAHTRKVYNDMADYFIAEHEGQTSSVAIVLTQMMRLGQIASGFLKVDNEERYIQVGNEKLKTLEDELEELIDAGEKVVVYARFRHEIEAIEKLCKKRRWKNWRYYGESKASKKREVARYPQAFQAHDGPAVFIGQCAMASLSIELGAASTAIFFSFDYSLINFEQCHDRVHSSESKKKVTYLYLLGKDSADEKALSALRRKKKVSTLLNNQPLINLLKLDSI